MLVGWWSLGKLKKLVAPWYVMRPRSSTLRPVKLLLRPWSSDKDFEGDLPSCKLVLTVDGLD
jgi:hypothetical protein